MCVYTQRIRFESGIFTVWRQCFVQVLFLVGMDDLVRQSRDDIQELVWAHTILILRIHKL